MFQPATWIQGRVRPSCRSGLDLANMVSIQMDRPKVTREVASAVQRSRFFFSEGMNSRASTPTSGKKVTMFRGLVIKSMLLLSGQSPVGVAVDVDIISRADNQE